MTSTSSRQGPAAARHGGEPAWVFGVVDRLAEHTHRDIELRNAYDALLRTADPGTRFLVQLLLEDERRHQQLTMALAMSVSGDEQALPAVPRGADSRLVERARALREAETADRDSLEHLRAELSEAADNELWQLVLDLLTIDADRRIRILQFVEGRQRVGL